ncbi:MAG: sulfotransferase family protein [Planctomycetes bacterium]|nr:sulfotransferase family protein [Planctomycetota bacterium]
MWSCPRTASTALMRAFENRTDTAVVDEPLYACYLAATDLPHPMAAEVLASQASDWRVVAAELTGPVPDGRRVFYQKHMAHHLGREIEREWLKGLVHCFLIRDPREVLPSLDERLSDPGLEDTGFAQQLELFEQVRVLTGRTPPVIDSRDLLEAPREVLGRLCDALAIGFDEAMLSWPAGTRPTDGVWADHWYSNVVRSTGFAPPPESPRPLPERLTGLLEACRGPYEILHAHRLRP